MNGYLLVARMMCDDMPLRLFATEAEMGEWLQYGKGTFEDEINRVATLIDWPTSTLKSIEAIRFIDGNPVEGVHVIRLEENQ